MIVSVALALAVVAIVAFGVALTVSSKRQYAASNQVVPGVATSAPASWAGAHTPEAKMHRRLRDAVAAARGNPRLVELGLAERTRRVETEALAIDERLVAAAGLPVSHRTDAVAAIEPHVAALEDAVATLVTSTTVADSKQLLESSISDADLKLQALAEARAEIERLDATIVDPLADLGTETAPPVRRDVPGEQRDDAPGERRDEPGTATG